jgi:hypothetical protein
MSSLADARKILDEQGWTKGTFTNEDGEVCLLGAIAEALPFTLAEVMRTDEVDRVTNVIEANYADRVPVWVMSANAFALGSTSFDVITKFNDHEDTTYTDVVAVLEKAETGA